MANGTSSNSSCGSHVTVDFVDVRDDLVGPLGAKGVGEIGQVGVAAAIANAVFHATGRRIPTLPIAPELVMDPG
jgi:xanthine dehydrogenase YagR molybdenum-binding subunit